MKKTLKNLLSIILAAAVFTVGVGAAVIGDTNGDGKLTVVDARQIIVAIANGTQDSLPKAADINSDGKISVVDARQIIVAIANDWSLGNIYTDTQALSQMSFDALKYQLFLDSDDNLNGVTNSLSFALLNAMLYEGVSSEQQSVFDDAYFYNQHEAVVELLNSYNRLSEITLNSSAFIRNAFGYKTDFTNALNENLGTDIFTDKAFDDTTISEINKWISDNTNGTISSLPTSISDETRVILNSASTFNSAWKNPFDNESNELFEFTNYDGTKQDVEMMLDCTPFLGYNDGDTVYMKSFEGDRYKFVAVMPEDDLVDYVFDFDADKFHSIMTETLVTQEVINVYFPKFTADTTFDFSEYYSEGFTFGNISDEEDLQIEMSYVSNAFTLNEKGVSASSAAQAQIAVGLGKVIKFDRPFMYMIVDTQNEVALYSGVVNNLGK